MSAWQSSMKIHESMADNRLRFAQRLNEMSEELATLVKEVDKNRKQVRRLNCLFALPLLNLCRPKTLRRAMSGLCKSQKVLRRNARTGWTLPLKNWSECYCRKRASRSRITVWRIGLGAAQAGSGRLARPSRKAACS